MGRVTSAPARPRTAKWRTTVETVLFIIGIPTALVTFVALLPQAWEFTHDRAHQYALVRSLHAGYTIDKFTSELGEPTLSTANGALTQYTYLGDEFAVTASADETGSVIAFGLLACHPDFRPTFDTPGGTTVRLNSAPLAEAETMTPRGRDISVGAAPRDDPLAIARFYTPNLSPGSDNIVVEPGLNSQAGSTSRPYVLGASEVCGTIDETWFSSPGALGADDEPTETGLVERFRSRVAPNFYGEAVFGDIVQTSYGACFAPNDNPAACARPVVGRLDLPFSFTDNPGTPWWRNIWPHE